MSEVTEDLYVTGSTIKKDSLLIANPISSFDNEDIKSRGTLYIENFLSFLPQINLVTPLIIQIKHLELHRSVYEVWEEPEH